MSEAQQAAAGANIGTTPTTDSDYLDAEQRAAFNIITSQPIPTPAPAPTVVYYDYPDAPIRQAINNPPPPVLPPVDLTGPAAVQQYATPEPAYVDQSTLIQSGLVTPPTQGSPSGTIIESIPASPPTPPSGVFASPDAQAGYGTTAPPAVLNDTQIEVLEDKVAAAVDAGTISEAAANKYYAEVDAYKVERDQALKDYQPASTKWTVEINGEKETFDSYEEAQLASIKSQKVTLLDPQGNTILDSSGKPLTFDSLDDAHLYIERQNEDYIQSQQYTDFKPTFGVGAIWNPPLVNDIMKNVDYLGNLIDEEAENQKLYGSDVLAGVLYSTGRAYRLGTGLVMGPALLPQTIYTLATDPGSVVNAMARDPIVSIANLALIGFGAAEAYGAWKAGAIGRNIKWASKLDDLDFYPTEPLEYFSTPLKGMETKISGRIVESLRDIRKPLAAGRSVGGNVPLETHVGGYETLDFAAMEKYIKGETVTGFAKDTLYGPNKEFTIKGMKPVEVFKGKINPADFEAGAFDYGGYGVKEPYPSVWGYYGSAEAIKNLFGESPLKVQPSGIGDMGVVTSERLYAPDYLNTLTQEQYNAYLAGSKAARETSGPTTPAVGGVESVSLEGTVSVSRVAEPYPVYGGGQLPNPYYVTPSGMVTSGIPLVGPGPLFYASVGSLLSTTPNAPSVAQIIPQISVTVPKIIANLNTREVQPILNLIDTDLLPKINTIINLTPAQTPRLDIRSINDQISRIEPIQIPIQAPIQAPIQEPILEPVQAPIQEIIQDQPPIQEYPPILETPMEPYPPEPTIPRPKTPKPLLRKNMEFETRRDEEGKRESLVGSYKVVFTTGRRESPRILDANSFHDALSRTYPRGSTPRVVEVTRLGVRRK